MTTRRVAIPLTVLLATVVTLALVVLFTWEPGSTPSARNGSGTGTGPGEAVQEAAPTAARPPAGPDTTTPTDIEPPTASPESAGQPPAEAPSLATLEGRVTRREDGRPVPDLAVRATFEEHPDAVSRTTTDGSYAFTFAEARTVRMLDVAPGPATSRLRKVLGRRVLPDLPVHVDLEVTTGARLAGRVIDGSGRFVPDAIVELWGRASYADDPPDRIAEADASGHFSLSAVGPDVVMQARAPGFVAAGRLAGTLDAGASVEGVDLVVEVRTDRPLEGGVVSTDGQPVPQARLLVAPRFGAAGWGREPASGLTRLPALPMQAVTDARGLFSVADVADRTLGLTVTHEEYRRWSGPVTPDGDALEIVLEGGAPLVGRVVGSAGEPVPGAAVALHLEGTRRTMTDASGMFRFVGLPLAEELVVAQPFTAAGDTGQGTGPGTGDGDAHDHDHPAASEPITDPALPVREPPPPAGYLVVTAAGFASEIVAPVTPMLEAARTVVVTLSAAQRIDGVVVDADGASVPGAEVVVQGTRVFDGYDLQHIAWYPWRPTWDFVAGTHDTHADEAGRFSFDGLHAGTHELFARDVATDTFGHASGVGTGTTQVRVVLHPRARLSGHVMDALSREPVVSFRIAVFDAKGDARTVAFESPDGRFDYPSPPEDGTDLTVEAPGYGLARVPLDARLAAGSEPMRIALRPERRLTVLALDATGAPVAGARVSCMDGLTDELLMLPSNLAPGLRVGTQRTDAKGELLLDGLPAGPVDVVVRPGSSADGGPVRRSVDLSVPYPRALEITLVGDGSQDL